MKLCARIRIISKYLINNGKITKYAHQLSIFSNTQGFGILGSTPHDMSFNFNLRSSNVVSEVKTTCEVTSSESERQMAKHITDLTYSIFYVISSEKTREYIYLVIW